jgi:HTH-type transcriptional regulator/antitoxin HigA
MSSSLDPRPTPGQMIKQRLQELGITIVEFAKRLGVSDKHASEMVNDRSGYSLEMCITMEEVLGVPATYWAQIQSTYQIDLIRAKRKADAEEPVAVE